ncbi:MAG: pilus assembly protein TadG-related protein, partial [candidate division WOR-3 bacterium]
MRAKDRKSTTRGLTSLVSDTDGQMLLLAVIVLTALLAFMLAIPNATRATTEKVRAQTAADAGAVSGSLWIARALNLNAHLNTGIRSMYTWMTVLTTAQALALALNSDSLDPSVRAIGQGLALALFGNSDPVYTADVLYPQSIQRLGETARLLYDLQSDVASSFPALAQALGSEQARRNISDGDPYSQNPGGTVVVRTADSIPLLEATPAGDSLLLSSLQQLAAALQTIPTYDSNIGPAHGIVTVDTQDYEIKAFYADTSMWYDIRQVLSRRYEKSIVQTFQNRQSAAIDSMIAYTGPGGSRYTAYLHGDSWGDQLLFCGEDGPHVPIIWPNGKPHPPYNNTQNWTLPSAASLLTGMFPTTHGAQRERDALSPEVLLLPQFLKQQGFRTAAFVANGHVSASTGFDRGWDAFKNYVKDGQANRADDVFRDALAWV